MRRGFVERLGGVYASVMAIFRQLAPYAELQISLDSASLGYGDSKCSAHEEQGVQEEAGISFVLVPS